MGAVAGGDNNIANDTHGTVGGGYVNFAYGNSATIAGGNTNFTQAQYATVSGGYQNMVTGTYGTIGGGYQNTVTGTQGTVGGGYSNTALADIATISGGTANIASGVGSTIAGGSANTASGTGAFVGGGYSNAANGYLGAVAGGDNNIANDSHGTVGGGYGNFAGGNSATIAGGYSNYVSDDSGTIGGGYDNTVSGDYGTVPGGNLNSASGNYSFAAGRKAAANNDGCFVWGDDTDIAVECNNDDRWVVRASGGVYFYSNGELGSGTFLAAGANSWSSISDRAAKENFVAANTGAILEAVANMPLYEYNLKSQDPTVHHLGPVAQDFHAAFDYGEHELAINMQDADGVALASIQALYDRSIELETENAVLQQQLTDLEGRLTGLEQAQGGSGTQPVLLAGLVVLLLLLIVGLIWTGWRTGLLRRNAGLMSGGAR
jgi:hypothetical protein